MKISVPATVSWRLFACVRPQVAENSLIRLGWETMIGWWPSAWLWIAGIWSKTPSPVRAILIAAFGTVVGAVLTSRSQAKRRIIDELKAIHVAYALCFTIVNKALAIKRQHIRPMKQRYKEAASAYDAFAAGPAGHLELDLDLRTLSQPRFATDTLERIVFEKCSLGHRGLAALVSLNDATDELNLSIDFRNNLISEFQKRMPATHEEKIAFYLGTYRNESVDQRFEHNIDALSHQVDDCVFFGMLLANELLTLERKLRARNRWKYRLNIPRQHPADWTLARNEDLIPDKSKYADWLKGFGTPPSIWKRLGAWIVKGRS